MNVEDLESTRSICRQALASPELREIGRRLREAGFRRPDIVKAVFTLVRDKYSDALWGPLVEPCLRAGMQEDSIDLQRYLLLETLLVHIDRIPDYPVAERVKELLLEEYRFIADPEPRWRKNFRPASDPFRTLCKMAVLQRFPAGQSDWEVSGLPRSWLLKMPRKDLPAVLKHVLLRMKGFKPYFVTHMSRRWPPVMLRRESTKSLWLIVESMKLQPRIKGTMSASWLQDPSLGEITPHLRWRLEEALRYGAINTNIGPAPENSGFLEGSPERRRLYESGAWRPVWGVTLWPREGLMRWAAAAGKAMGK